MTIHFPPPPEFMGDIRLWQEQFRLWRGACFSLRRAFGNTTPPTHQISYLPVQLTNVGKPACEASETEVPFLQLYNPETGDMFFFPEYALDELINRSPNPKAMRNVIEYLAQFMSEHGDHDKSLDTFLKYGDPDDREIIAYFCKLASYEGYAKVRPLGRGRRLRVPQSGIALGAQHPELVEPS